MKKTLPILFTLLLINNILAAEIIHQKNDFDDSNIVMSVFQKENINLSNDMPTEIVLRKLNNDSTDKSYVLFMKNPYTLKDLYVNIEPAKIKINNDISKVYYQNFSLDDYGKRTRISIPFSINIVKEIPNANSIQLQIPVFTRDKTQIKYVEYTIPTSILDEWKQVIAME